uniref:Uncharacterized protein n=1 Tax=Trichuris muris TaxID=70415 RepID=A0A5S6QM05_TRIMR
MVTQVSQVRIEIAKAWPIDPLEFYILSNGFLEESAVSGVNVSSCRWLVSFDESPELLLTASLHCLEAIYEPPYRAVVDTELNFQSAEGRLGKVIHLITAEAAKISSSW